MKSENEEFINKMVTMWAIAPLDTRYYFMFHNLCPIELHRAPIIFLEIFFFMLHGFSGWLIDPQKMKVGERVWEKTRRF